MQRFGAYLRSLREDFGLSAREVARRTGLTPSYISKLEKGGAFQSVSVQTVRSFAEIYRIPLQALLEQSGFLKEEEGGLPGLAAYFKAKYRAPHQAVQEMEIVWEIVKKKYLLS